MKIGAIIQARTSSTRLPGKVLKHLPYNSKITVLGQVIRRLKKSELLDMIIVATTMDTVDEQIVDIATGENVPFFRGSKDNVLERYYTAAVENNLDIVVRVTSDCPCIDPSIADYAIINHLEVDADYTSNSLVRSFPHGLDVEVFDFKVLEQTYLEATLDFEKEHVTPFIYKSNPESFKINNIKADKEYTAPDIRITLDTMEDYALLCTVYDYLYPMNNFFNIGDIIDLFKSKPWLKLVNKKVVQKKVNLSVEEELVITKEFCDLQELSRVSELLDNLLK
jgi:spore coat polysaccharide biosynthesis protein SpsF